MAASNQRISFTCPNCGRDLRAAGSLGGRVTVCPHCDRKLIIPTGTEATPPAGTEPVIEQTAVYKQPPPRAAS